MNLDRKICSRCILDTTVPEIQFDEHGLCNYCKIHDKFEELYPLNEIGKERIRRKVEKIKRKGIAKKYDCIVGVSGGTDSTYCLYLAKKWGLKPLAIHLDNGWDTEIAMSNMRKATEKLGIDLKIIKVDWEEFKNLQIAFLKASVSDAEIPTDIGIYSVLYRVAVEEGIPYVINGHSFRTEGTCPIGWTYMDGKYIDSVYKKFGEGKLKSFPNLKISNLLYYIFIKRIKEFRPLEYISYDKVEAGKILEKKLGWKYYGGHHYESIYTRFVVSFLLLKKFHIDKRKVSFSALIRTGQITREEALQEIRELPYPKEKVDKDKEYVIKKFELTDEEFDRILAMKPKKFLDYPTYYSTIRKLRFFIKIACKLKLLPEIFYEKYSLKFE